MLGGYLVAFLWLSFVYSDVWCDLVVLGLYCNSVVCDLFTFLIIDACVLVG